MLTYGYKDTNLDGSLILRSFTKIIIVGPPIGACELPNLGFMARPVKWALHPIRKQ